MTGQGGEQIRLEPFAVRVGFRLRRLVGAPGPGLHPESRLVRRRHRFGVRPVAATGLMTAGEQLTDADRAFREEIEVRTDELVQPLLDALGGGGEVRTGP